MKKILIINGPNLNMLGKREPELYGKKTYPDLICSLSEKYDSKELLLSFFQSNSEGEIVTTIQNALNKYDGIVINGGAYAHTSIAILDALKSVCLPTVNVHITNVKTREKFRQNDYIKLYAEKTISGKGFDGYSLAIEYLLKKWK